MKKSTYHNKIKTIIRKARTGKASTASLKRGAEAVTARRRRAKVVKTGDSKKLLSKAMRKSIANAKIKKAKGGRKRRKPSTGIGVGY